jgi:hypothetical protein
VPCLGPAICLALASACTTYPQRTAEAFGDFQRGHLQESMAAYADPERVGSHFLSGAEAGMAAWTAGDWEQARTHLDRAAAAAADIEERALVSAERLGESLASWVVNDTSQAYQGEGFERVYVHCLLAMSYLAQGSLDAVGVEVRLADRLLTAEEELYDKRYAAGGLGHLISAVAYELRGEPDQAYIDYERMHEKGVGTALAGRALVRLARQLARSEDLARWEELYGADFERPPEAASVVLVAGVGIGPYKEEGRLPIPTEDGLIPIAVPSYRARPQPVSAVRLIDVESGTSVRSDLIESVADVARENLEDRLLFTAAKSVARGVLKRQLTKELEDELDDDWEGAGRLIGDLYALISERADLRAWLTLPDTWQALRLFVAPGAHTLEVDAVGGARQHLGSFELEPGETMVVFVRTIGTDLYAHAIGGRLLETPEHVPAESPAGPPLEPSQP